MRRLDVELDQIIRGLIYDADQEAPEDDPPALDPLKWPFTVAELQALGDLEARRWIPLHSWGWSEREAVGVLAECLNACVKHSSFIARPRWGQA